MKHPGLSTGPCEPTTLGTAARQTRRPNWDWVAALDAFRSWRPGTRTGKGLSMGRIRGHAREDQERGHRRRRQRPLPPLQQDVALQDRVLGSLRNGGFVLAACRCWVGSGRVSTCGQTSEPQATANGEVAWWQCGRSRIRASMNAKPRAWRHGIGRLCRVIRSGARPRTAPTRSPCWRSRTVPASRTWCRSVTAG